MSTLMEVKSKNSPSEKKRKSLLSFVGDLKDELKKVSWTTKKELISATKNVVIATLVFGLGIYVIDLTIKGLLELVKKAIMVLFG